jgi:YidC/Oxa1 family membrane protein insertase
LDRNTVIGLSLIFVIFLGWMYYMQPSAEQMEQMRRERIVRDSLEQMAKEGKPSSPSFAATVDVVENDQQAISGAFGESTFSDTVRTGVDTDLYHFTFSNLGAGPVEVFLKQYDRWDGAPVQLFKDTLHSAYSLGFVTTENYNVETRGVLFTPITKEPVRISGDETAELSYELPVKTGRLIVTYTFFGNKYQVGVKARFEGISTYVSGRKVDFAFKSGLATTEKFNSIEAKESAAHLYAGDEHEKLLITKAGKQELNATGAIDWVATKSKFFTQVIKPNVATDAAYLHGEVTGDLSTENARSKYESQITVSIPDDNILSFDLYLGPVRLTTLSDFHDTADDLVNVGYEWMRFFSEPLVKFVIIPFFDFFGGLIGNYGLVIILFGIGIKLVLYPFTKKSFESAAAMRQLAPEMTAIKEKVTDPQKQQEAIMKLYKTAGVNPIGGCLPNLLQMPILVTLWMYFQNSILIRQKSFLWASDLSAPDVILSLPFHIPFLGDHISGFVLLMAASMVVQMQTSGQTQSNPQMKFLPYMMPIMLFFFFNSVASGLSLYYLVYNVVSIAQQLMINKSVDHTKLMASIEGKPKSAAKLPKKKK